MSEFFSGLLGAVIGSVGTCLTVYLQTRSELKMKMYDKIAELALVDRKTHIELAEKTPGSGRTAILPISAYLYYHYKVFESMVAGNLDVKKLKEFGDEQAQLLKVLKE